MDEDENKPGPSKPRELLKTSANTVAHNNDPRNVRPHNSRGTGCTRTLASVPPEEGLRKRQETKDRLWKLPPRTSNNRAGPSVQDRYRDMKIVKGFPKQNIQANVNNSRAGPSVRDLYRDTKNKGFSKQNIQANANNNRAGPSVQDRLRDRNRDTKIVNKGIGSGSNQQTRMQVNQWGGGDITIPQDLREMRQGSNSKYRNGARNRYRCMGFLILEKISNSNTSDIFLTLNEHKEGFMDLLNSPIRSFDMIILIFDILGKVSQSPFEAMKSKLFLDVCNSNFILLLRNYLTDLPYTRDKSQNNMYWNNQNQFWKNFITFSQEVVNISPSTAIRTCRPLIESVSKTCLEYLNTLHGFVLPEEDALRFESLRNKLIAFVDKPQSNIVIEKDGAVVVQDDPPNDFRELSAVPTREDLLDDQPFLRPNIVNGAYPDVEHYLDIQFRLLREDCFGPLRVGINQFLTNPNRRNYDNIHVIHNVKFMGPYISNFKMGTLVQLDIENNKIFKKIHWAHSKRLLFGSLVAFTKNNFRDVIFATVLDRDNISTGKLAVSILDSSSGSNFRDGDAYIMIESQVYFEPYLHVLKALQAPSFPEQLPMQQYIVKVNPLTDNPRYLTADNEYVIKYESEEFLGPDINDIKFTVLKTDSWPTKEELKLNESQYEAFKLALTHEFSVLQGPPGTGKTYVGLKIANALLQNIKSPNQCLMLVICYTNHALDQFLVEISKITNNIVRIGGQSRNKDLEQFNLVNLRKTQLMRESKVHDYFIEVKNELKRAVNEFKESILLLDILNHGVINHEYLKYVPEVRSLCEYYKQYFPSVKDPLSHWLFENSNEYQSDFGACLDTYENFTVDIEDNEYNSMRTDYNIILEEDKSNNMENLKEDMAAFMVLDTKLKLANLIRKYYDKYSHITEMQIVDLNAKLNLYTEMIQHRSEESTVRIKCSSRLSSMSTRVRWRLYFTWIKKIVNETKEQIANFEEVLIPLAERYEEARMLMDLELLQNKTIQVLGLTTSGAARMRKLLNAVLPKIVIVEEAAEVLEQHIVTSLTQSCQHLILIGDHQQLRPSAAFSKLARQYNIEVSLFERMITNGIHSRRLSVQHRMRPEIAALISPHIYSELENHPSVENFGDVMGLDKNVFFFTHEYREEVESNGSKSRVNYKEADLTLALANYIMQQGYKSGEVTILTAYSGQMFYMRKERHKYALLKDVKITVVDNYQGEESRIILLSLVRNNTENTIGFLGTENRICVALSRAKEGFYMLGNIDMLKLKSELWRKIATTLEKDGALGTVLNLKCKVHSDNITPVVSAEDFQQVPEGGCLKKCDYLYPCGHRCWLYCHAYDRKHVDTKCLEPCERIVCELGHVCPLKCSMDCEQCKVYIQKTLPCGHEMDVFCHLEPEDPQVKCNTIVEAVLPKCGHKVQKLCSVDVQDVKCTEICKQRVESCGHACKRACHVSFPDHKSYVCFKACSRKNKRCMADSQEDLTLHKCNKQCYEECDDCNVQVTKKRNNCKHSVVVACCVDVNSTPCRMNCARMMACGHHCKKKCSEPCGDCKAKVTKVIPDCNHKVKVECQAVVRREDCTKQCERSLKCGHRCMAVCGIICDEKKCTQIVSLEVNSPCGHKVKLPCNVYNAYITGQIVPEQLLRYCNTPCGKELACSHLCGGTCSKCYQGRMHAPCKQTCNQIYVCGHQCQEPCNQICPPCDVICEIQCEHSRCGRTCGELCVQCKEKCSRSCPHGSCTRLCSETCSRAACTEPCAKTLSSCGHRCRGVCGEPCPDVCRVCRPDTFPTDFLGDEYGDDEMFILLEDCGHFLTLSDADNLMMGNQDSIKIRQCPFCRKPILNTKRYKDVVSDMFKHDLNIIKQRTYGTSKEINTKLHELFLKVVSLDTTVEHSGVRMAINKLKMFLKQKCGMSLLQVEMLLIYYDIVTMISEYWKKIKMIKKLSIFDEEIKKSINIILSVLKMDLKSKVPVKISEQQQKDVNNEMKRLNAIVKLDGLFEVWMMLNQDPKYKAYVDAAKTYVCTVYEFDENKAIEALNTLNTEMKAGEDVIKMERQMIVKAIGVKAGAWYKCPNGHYYCIGDCGGATVIAKCPECGAQVGGLQHTLLSSNSHAPEMDGSKYPAYSVEANNMANFLFDN